MPNKRYNGFYSYIPGGSTGIQDRIARMKAGQAQELEPRPVTPHPLPKMTPYEEGRWRNVGVPLEFTPPPITPRIVPTPEFAIGQTVAFVAWLTFLTDRKLSPSRQGWLYEFSDSAGWVAEASLKPIGQEVPFDDLDLVPGVGDWIPSTWLEREDESLPLAV